MQRQHASDGKVDTQSHLDIDESAESDSHSAEAENEGNENPWPYMWEKFSQLSTARKVTASLCAVCFVYRKMLKELCRKTPHPTCINYLTATIDL